MHIKEMHYDFKQKLNKLDSQAYKNLLVPEIDWKLNEAAEVLIKIYTQPRFAKQIGYEINQRSIDDFRTIIVDQFFENNDCLVVTQLAGNKYQTSLPNNYLYYIRGYAVATKGSCTDKKLRAFQKSRGDMHEESQLDNSSFEWREINIETRIDRFTLYSDGTFTPTHFCLSYLRKPLFMHNAADHPGGQYYKPDGTTLLAGTQACELPEVLHREVVDMAVLITKGDLVIPGYDLAAAKVKLTE